MPRRFWPLTLLLLTLMLLCAASVIAAGADPGVYLTANLTAVATTVAVTPMEQALFDLVDDAETSIDAAIYDFERVSIRGALIAAHTHGVAMRIVDDDEARASLRCTLYFSFGGTCTLAGHHLMWRDASINVIDSQQLHQGNMSTSWYSRIVSRNF